MHAKIDNSIFGNALSWFKPIFIEFAVDCVYNNVNFLIILYTYYYYVIIIIIYILDKTNSFLW